MAIETRPAVEVRQLLTPADVERMLACGELDPDKIWELIDGELVELPPSGFEHSDPEFNVLLALGIFAKRIGGKVSPSNIGFTVGANFQQLRSPDVSFFGPNRRIERDGAWGKGAADLAVEILSANQYGEAYARTKVREYFAAGSQLVWLVHIRRKEVRVYRPGADEYAIMRGGAILTLEPIVAGFELRVADIFEE